MTNEDIIEKLATHESKLNACERRINDLEKMQTSIHNLTVSVEKMAVSLSTNTNAINSLQDRVRLQEQEDGDSFKQIKMSVVTCIISVIVTAILSWAMMH